MKEKTPTEIMAESIDLGLTDFYVAYSGGKDSGIALDFMAKEFPQYFKGVVFVNTGIGTQATVDFVEEYCKKRNYTLHHLHAEDVKRKKITKNGKIGEPFDFEHLVLAYGFPKQALHTVTMRWLKLFSIRKFVYERIALGENPAIVSGIRKNESARRKTKAKKYIYNDGKMWFISPLYYKSNGWVMKYFIENDIKRSPVYETLHISGDCLCGCFAKKEELKLLEMFHPDVFTEIKRLEKLVKEKGSPEAKKNSVWGIHNQTTESVEAQDNLEAYVCSECFFDNTGKEADTKRFNDEMEDIDKKLEKMKNDT
tara:strand:+ start:207 stop:1139 length:933 start_codon:yes stop_codon:yes gene_type:complete